MAAVNFDEALRRVLAHEGGYTNHPSDPGGPTNFGITIGDYRKYVKASATADDVRKMSIEDAKHIYRLQYWQALRCDALPSGIDYAVFDYGVNSGTGRAAKVLRRLLKRSGTAGPIDDAVIAAAASTGAAGLAVAICDERLAFLQSLKTWPVFGAGWKRRVNEVKAVALQMTKTAVSERPRVSATKVVTASTVIAAGAAAHGAGADPTLIVVAIAVAAVIAAVGWLAWRRIKDR